VLRFLPLGVVVINRGYRIVTVNGVARRLLGIRDAGHDQDFLHTVRGLPYALVRSAIDTVFRERGTATLEDLELDASVGGNGRYLTLTLALLQGEAGNSDLALVSISDVTEQNQTRRRLEGVQAEQQELVDKLGATNLRLSQTNQELQDANEELQAANEEMMLAQEELQATNEELEATNEELQATNEELETNNEELQATNEELETTNEELTARTSELQEVARLFEGERIRLSRVVEQAPFYMMILRGPDLILEAFHARFGRLQDGRAVQGRPLLEVADCFWNSSSEVVDVIRGAYQDNAVRTSPRIATYVHDQDEQSERSFVYTIVPSHANTREVDGVVLYAEEGSG
jgi:two-component system CheB/CheR fusion protein